MRGTPNRASDQSGPVIAMVRPVSNPCGQVSEVHEQSLREARLAWEDSWLKTLAGEMESIAAFMGIFENG